MFRQQAEAATSSHWQILDISPHPHSAGVRCCLLQPAASSDFPIPASSVLPVAAYLLTSSCALSLPLATASPPAISLHHSAAAATLPLTSAAPGGYKAWAVINGRMHTIPLRIPRSFYINSTLPPDAPEASALGPTLKRVLPGGREVHYVYQVWKGRGCVGQRVCVEAGK